MDGQLGEGGGAAQSLGELIDRLAELEAAFLEGRGTCSRQLVSRR
jgi:hypothetical protein